MSKIPYLAFLAIACSCAYANVSPLASNAKHEPVKITKATINKPDESNAATNQPKTFNAGLTESNLIVDADVSVNVNAYGGQTYLFEKVDDGDAANDLPSAFFSNAMAIDFDGSFGHRLIHPPLQLIFGAQAKLFMIPASTDNIGTIDNVYIGLGSPYGTFKYGVLSADPEGTKIDISLNNGINMLSIYGGSDPRLKKAFALESANWNGLTFHLTMGTSGYLTGLTDDLEPVIKDILAYSGGFTYQKNGPFVRYNGYVKQNNDDENPYSKHRFEVGYEGDNLFFALGYQTTKSLESWGNLTDMATSAQRTALKIDIEALNKIVDKGGMAKLPLFKTNEMMASLSYKIGKIKPKISWVYGQGSKGTVAVQGTVGSGIPDPSSGTLETFDFGNLRSNAQQQLELANGGVRGRKSSASPNLGYDEELVVPDYQQYVVGVDYLMDDHVTFGFYYGKIAWSYDSKTPKSDQLSDKAILGLGFSYQF